MRGVPGLSDHVANRPLPAPAPRLDAMQTTLVTPETGVR